MIDHMVIRLGKYLRIAGYDAAWDLSCRTHELIINANKEGRVFLTCNRHLEAEYPKPRQWLLLYCSDPVEQFQEVVRHYGLESMHAPFSRCIRCNRVLQPVEKAALQTRVHPNVYMRYQHYYTCPSCGTVFWKGTHVRNTCRKLNLENCCELDT